MSEWETAGMYFKMIFVNSFIWFFSLKQFPPALTSSDTQNNIDICVVLCVFKNTHKMDNIPQLYIKVVSTCENPPEPTSTHPPLPTFLHKLHVAPQSTQQYSEEKLKLDPSCIKVLSKCQNCHQMGSYTSANIHSYTPPLAVFNWSCFLRLISGQKLWVYGARWPICWTPSQKKGLKKHLNF